ncbi:hypothetical protein [Solirubrobacter soli]|uniref:hypothetical protein n=1 Tax=Solirubrobacter soli TaxID=363832 RepID=UPI00040D2B1D|nr:hypothetical protein [Solirubrobacter soli]
MLELSHADDILGQVILTFDGRVLEKFSERSAEAERMIVGLLHLEVTEPDRKGRREVWFTCRPKRRGGGFRLTVADEEWAGVEPFVRDVGAAL